MYGRTRGTVRNYRVRRSSTYTNRRPRRVMVRRIPRRTRIVRARRSVSFRRR